MLEFALHEETHIQMFPGEILREEEPLFGTTLNLKATSSFVCLLFISKIFLQATEEHLVRLFDKYVQSLLDFKRVSCTDMVPIAELNGIESLCVLLGALLTEENGVRNTLFHAFQYF